MRTNRRFFSVLAAVMLPFGAMAGDNFNYTYLDIQYTDNGIDETYTESFVDESATVSLDGGGGFAVHGSLALTPSWHAFAVYAATDVDLQATVAVEEGQESLKIGGDVDDWRVGLGYNISLTDKVDGLVQIAYEDRKVDFGSVTLLDETMSLDVDDDGFAALVGLRGNVTDNFEMNGHVRYSQVLGINLAAEANKDVLDDDVLFGVGGIFHVNDTFSLGASIEAGDSTAWYTFARVEFGS